MTPQEALSLAAPFLPHWQAREPQLIKARENIVFRVTLPSGPAALRLHRPGYQSRAGVEAELIWTEALAAEGFPCPRPLPTIAGARTAQEGAHVASVVSWVEGAPIGAAELPLAGSPDEQRALMTRLGALVARLHDVTDRLGLPLTLARPQWDADGYLGAAPLWGPFWQNPAFSTADLALIEEARTEARHRIAALERPDTGLIHADVLRENLLAEGARLTLIDFDDSGWGFRLYDLATALVQSLEEPALPDIAEGLIAGYSALRPLDTGSLPLFVMLRTFASAGWIATRAAADDPRQAFYAGRATRMARQVLDGTAPWHP